MGTWCPEAALRYRASDSTHLKGHGPLDACYRIDLIVEDTVVVEVKAVAAMLPVYQAQTLTYMRMTKCPAGLLINFNVPKLVNGVKRLINPRAG